MINVLNQLRNRVGPTNYSLPYANAGVSTANPGEVRLKFTSKTSLTLSGLKKTWFSAGCLGPECQNGLWEFGVRCRMGSLDLNATLSAWFHNDVTGRGFDIFEAIAAGSDPNREYNLCSTNWENTETETILARDKYESKDFNRFQFIFNKWDTGYSLTAHGWQPSSNRWIQINGGMSGPVTGHFGNLRLGLWLPKKGFYYADDALARGPLEAVFEYINFTPA